MMMVTKGEAMRVTIKFDSATTEQVRLLAVALHKVGKTGQLQVGVNGPEHWCGETPPLRPNEFADVVGNLITYKGEIVGDVLTGADR
jgi:hypothetical protein